MFNRTQYKLTAKEKLKGNWGSAALCTFLLFLNVAIVITLMTIIGMLVLAPVVAGLAGSNLTANSTIAEVLKNASTFNFFMIMIILLFAFVLCSAILSAYLTKKQIQISEKLYQGEKLSGGSMYSDFKYTWKMFCLIFMVNLFTALWSMLFVIPGIYKSLTYTYAPFILLENPEMSVLDCITMSRKVAKGHAMGLFVLYLSFIGWMIVSSFTLGIGTLFLTPYMNLATYCSYKALNGDSGVNVEAV